MTPPMFIQKTSAAAETPGPERSSNESGRPPTASAGTTEAPAFPRRVSEDLLNELAGELATRLNELVDNLEKRS